MQDGQSPAGTSDGHGSTEAALRALRWHASTSMEGVYRSGRFGTAALSILAKYKINTSHFLSNRPEGEDTTTTVANRECAEQALDLVLDMKGYYIKAAQTLCGAGMFPKEFDDVFAVLLDQCPSEPYEVVQKIVETELGCSMVEVFRDFSREALAAASIGQVHKATLLDGTRVVVKVQYPQVEEYFRMDVSTVGFLLRVAGMGSQVRDIFKRMEDSLEVEFDYVREANIMRECAENVAPVFEKRAVIPLPIDALHPASRFGPKGTLCTRKVLTMEYLDGTPIRAYSAELMEVFARLHGMSVEELKQMTRRAFVDGLDKENSAIKQAMNMGETSRCMVFSGRLAVAARNGLVRAATCCSTPCSGGSSSSSAGSRWRPMKVPLNGIRVAKLLFEIHGHQIFENGLFNSDPHAGNVLMLKDGRLGLLDYGAAMRLSVPQRKSLAKLFIAIADEDDDATAEAHFECGLRLRNRDRRLSLLLAHLFYNRGPYPYDMNRIGPKVGLPPDPDVFVLDEFTRGGKLDVIEEFPGHLFGVQRCSMVLSGVGMELGAGRLSAAAHFRPAAKRWLERKCQL